MRNLTTILTSVFVLVGMNVSSVRLHPQERPTANGQAPNPGPHVFAGCYRVALLSWSPSNPNIHFIPTRFELLSAPRVPGATGFGIRSLDAEAGSDSLWSWRPKGKDELKIAWNRGLGGFRGTLKRSGSGQLVGKIKEYCDSHCGYKRATGSLRLEKIACGPNSPVTTGVEHPAKS